MNSSRSTSSVKRTEQADELLAAVVARVNAGEELNDVAAEVGLQAMNPEQLATRPMDPNMPNPLLSAAFSLEEGAASVMRDPQAGPMVVMVREVQPIDPEQRPQAEAQVQSIVRGVAVAGPAAIVHRRDQRGGRRSDQCKRGQRVPQQLS